MAAVVGVRPSAVVPLGRDCFGRSRGRGARHVVGFVVGGFLSQSRIYFFFFQAEDGIRDLTVTGVQTCALPIWCRTAPWTSAAARPRTISRAKSRWPLP